MRRVCFILGGLLVMIGCHSQPLAEVQAPEQLTLFSIDGRDVERRGEDKAGAESFHGYPVLGKVEITEPEQRKEVLAALQEGITRGKSLTMAKCFWPRHGIRTVENGKTVEYVICFECSQFDEFLGEVRKRHAAIDPNVQPTFDKPLRDAGVPIAPK